MYKKSFFLLREILSNQLEKFLYYQFNQAKNPLILILQKEEFQRYQTVVNFKICLVKANYPNFNFKEIINSNQLFRMITK